VTEEIDQAAEAFTTEIAPPSRPRDQGGKFVQTVGPPQALFEDREVEGAGDAGDDAGRRSREREVARGSNKRQTDVDDVHGSADAGPERIGSGDEGAEDGELDDDELAAAGAKEVSERREAPDEGDKYEVIVDGQPTEVSLGEALNGYVRQETFHRRMTELSQLRAGLEEDSRRQQANWGLLMQAKEAYEADVRTMLPTEPDWDREYAINPQAAHQNQKVYQALYAKLNQSRAERGQMEAMRADEADRQLKKYAVDGFSRFVFDSKIPDEAALKKEIQSMRKTAFSAGFSEQEVATVYDPRMLSILRKASKYDRMMAAAKPQAVVPGKGRTLTPGSATPLGNAPRKGLDEASRRLANSGRLDDAVDVFRRML
jgi:hypothetical protein